MSPVKSILPITPGCGVLPPDAAMAAPEVAADGAVAGGAPDVLPELGDTASEWADDAGWMNEGADETGAEAETDAAGSRITDGPAAANVAAVESVRSLPLGGRGRGGRPRGRRLVPVAEARRLAERSTMSATQRLLVLDTWSRSGLPAGDFAPLVGVSKHTLYAWKQRFEAAGPGGLMDRPRGAPGGSRLAELTKRTILMLKKAHAEWGTQRISDELARGPGLAASASAVGRVLHEAGYELEERLTQPHPDKIRFFERAAPNQLWQSDLFTFMLKRQNQRVHLVAFLDDHSRFVVSYGLHASQSAALVIETFRAGIASFGAPAEVLTDNGAQYVTWRGTSAFAKECSARGVKQIVARPRHPQTLGKTERFWGTLWREFLEAAVFADLSEARTRVGLFIDHYNFQRPHQGIGGLVPADRFFAAAPAVRASLTARLAANALELARGGVPKPPLYLTGNVGGTALTLHGEGDQVVLTHGERRTVVALTPPTGGALPTPATVAAGMPATTAADPMESLLTESGISQPQPQPQALAPCAVVASPWTGAAVLPPGVSALDGFAPISDAAPSAVEVRS
jgi:transposase InsO family protein